MHSSSFIVLALAVFGASAQSFVSSGCGVGYNGLNTVSGFGVNGLGINGLGVNGLGVNGLGVNGFGMNGLSVSGVGAVPATIATTPVVENVPIRIPSVIQPTAVQDTCSCVKTIVKPTMRKEIITVPSVQRFVQTTTTPVVETVPYVKSAAADVPTVGVSTVNGVVGTGYNGIVGSGLVGSGLIGSGLVGSGLVNSGLVGTGFNGIVGTGLAGSGCSGIVGSGLLGSGLNGVVGTGYNGVMGTGLTC